MTSRTMSLAFILFFAGLWFDKMDPKITFSERLGRTFVA